MLRILIFFVVTTGTNRQRYDSIVTVASTVVISDFLSRGFLEELPSERKEKKYFTKNPQRLVGMAYGI